MLDLTTAILHKFNNVSGLTVMAVGLVLAAVVAFVHLVAYVFDSKGLRSYPGPFLAKLSHAWVYNAASSGKLVVAIHEEHITHGKFVRLAPDHVSIADPAAIQPIYGHNSGQDTLLKSNFYSALDQFSGSSTLFTTRSRQDHARKRKMVAHSFSAKSVAQYEPIVRKYNRILIQHWDRMCASATKGHGGNVGECHWQAKDGRACFDCLPWFNYQVFDIIGDLVFDSPFGMTSSVTDKAQISKSQKAVIDAYGVEEANIEYENIAAVKEINERSKITIVKSVVPPTWRPIINRLPWLQKRRRAMESIATLSATAVLRRLKGPASRDDNILTRLLESRDENGQPMGKMELSAEAMTLLIAGTDTTSNSSAAITYYLAHNQEAQRKLQSELDSALGPPSSDSIEDDDPARGTWDELKNLTYLHDAINEGLRVFSTVGIGLPRVVPEGGMTILGEHFTAGTIVSVPTYTIHRDASIWGPDAEHFNPDRWSSGDRIAMQKAFVPFSVGPRACIGRNLAFMEMCIFIGNLFHRYHIAPATSDPKFPIKDSFLRKPDACTVAVKRRAC